MADLSNGKDFEIFTEFNDEIKRYFALVKDRDRLDQFIRRALSNKDLVDVEVFKKVFDDYSQRRHEVLRQWRSLGKSLVRDLGKYRADRDELEQYAKKLGDELYETRFRVLVGEYTPGEVSAREEEIEGKIAEITMKLGVNNRKINYYGKIQDDIQNYEGEETQESTGDETQEIEEEVPRLEGVRCAPYAVVMEESIRESHVEEVTLEAVQTEYTYGEDDVSSVAENEDNEVVVSDLDAEVDDVDLDECDTRRDGVTFQPLPASEPAQVSASSEAMSGVLDPVLKISLDTDMSFEDFEQDDDDLDADELPTVEGREAEKTVDGSGNLQRLSPDGLVGDEEAFAVGDDVIEVDLGVDEVEGNGEESEFELRLFGKVCGE